MKADCGYKFARRDHKRSSARSAASMREGALLLILTVIGWLAVDVPGTRRGEAASLSGTEEAQLEGGIIVAPTDSPTAQVPMPDNAPTELQAIARDAIAGQPDAEHDLGTIFALGIEVPQNLESAAYWYRRAADQGVINANYDLGMLLELGLGVPRDPAAAVARFRKAADAGHADAQNALGLASLGGSGVARDPEEALNWFRRAGAGGNPRGAYNAGRLYENGDLGVPDRRAATDWYRIAADAGDAKAKAALERLQAAAHPSTPVPLGAGFVILAPDTSFFVATQTTEAAARPEPILDNQAAQMATREPDVSVEAPVIPAVTAEPRVTTGQIKEIQQLLGQLNFDAGRADGRMRRKTGAAIADFQESRELPVTGRPSVALLEALRTAAQSTVWN